MDNPLPLFVLSMIVIIVALLVFAELWYQLVEPVIRRFIRFVFRYNEEDRH